MADAKKRGVHTGRKHTLRPRINAPRPCGCTLRKGRASARWPELTKRPPGTHKDFAVVPENPSAEVSVYPANPTGFSVQTVPWFFSLI
jgi:hypothetical protein